MADRLFKIRHCMTIEGVVRQLPLFEPPIDPSLLVRAVSAGVDISSALSDLNAPLPSYRFQIMLQKAVELCNDVKTLGGALLSALEKRDAEELALLRSRHEIQLLKAVKQIKEQQIEDARESLAALEESLKSAEKRKDHYESRGYINAQEQLNLDKLESAHEWELIGQIIEVAGQALPLIGDFKVGTSGWAGSPVATWEWGGLHLGAAAKAASSAMSLLAMLDSNEAKRASIKGGYDRRMDDWTLQAELASIDIEQIKKQITSAEIRLAITEHELENHGLQIENTVAVDETMRNKFTNHQLYGWMVSQISSLYFQSYQLAYDLAKRAEKAFQYELGLSDINFIEFGYWDSLKKGLLAGERLQYDLRRMELAHLEKNRREYELTKHISLAMLDPLALVMLKETCECFVNLPEAIFDLEYPGHYMRRIKSVSLTIPCVTGPYTSVNCRLTLLGNRVRKETSTSPGYKYQGLEDTRFQHNLAAIQSISTSSGQNDSGLFELNFRDERYLPFEGAGAISQWRIELPKEFRQFDYNTISDIVIHLRYTAREGGEILNKSAVEHLKKTFATDGDELQRLFSLRHEFPSEWHRFLHDDPDYEQTFEVHAEHFPFVTQGKTIKFQKLILFLQPTVDFEEDLDLAFELTSGEAKPISFEAKAYEKVGALLYQDAETLNGQLSAESPQINWKLKIASDVIPKELQVENGTSLDPDKVENIVLLCHYTIIANENIS